jgi:hypothetical protein
LEHGQERGVFAGAEVLEEGVGPVEEDPDPVGLKGADEPLVLRNAEFQVLISGQRGQCDHGPSEEFRRNRLEIHGGGDGEALGERTHPLADNINTFPQKLQSSKRIRLWVLPDTRSRV